MLGDVLPDDDDRAARVRREVEPSRMLPMTPWPRAPTTTVSAFPEAATRAAAAGPTVTAEVTVRSGAAARMCRRAESRIHPWSSRSVGTTIIGDHTVTVVSLE
jgi:hypothetical protein